MKQSIIGRAWVPLSADLVAEPLDPATRLTLAGHVRVVREDGLVRKLDLGGKLASLGVESGRQITALLTQLDGKTTLAEAAQALAWELDETVEAAQDLYHLAALENVGDTTIGSFAFFQHVSALGVSIQARIGEDARQLLPRLMDERPTRRLLLGYLVEFYHIVLRASVHISPSINTAPNERLRMMLSEYLGDEYWHGLWLRKGLIAAGLTEAELERCDPLPATLAAIDRLRALSSSDLLAYAACITTSEGTGDKQMERLLNRYAAIERHGLLPPEAIEPFREHEIADCNAAHFSFVAEMYAEAPPITRGQQDSIRRAMLGYLRCLEEQQHQIQRFYGGSEDGPAAYTTRWTPPPVAAPNRDLSLAEVAARLGDNHFYVFDCGALDRYRAGHLPGAIWLDPAAITPRALPQDPQATLLFYCTNESCGACELGAERAKQLGFRNVFVMRAGMDAWRSAARAIERAG